MTDNDVLIELMTKGNTDARDKIVENNMGLVYGIARRFIGRGYDFEELCQIGAIGLIKAVDNFKTEYGVKLSTYAVPVIMGEIKRFLRDDGPVKVARSLKELSARAMKEKERLEALLGREVGIKELAEATDAEPEKLAMALSAAAPMKSLYEKTNPEEDTVLLDKIAESESQEERIVTGMALKNALSMLDKREQSVILMRYFRNMTQEEVAHLLGVSQVQVSRLEGRAKGKLKKELLSL